MVSDSIWVPSDVERSFFYQFVDLTLKSPVISTNKGFLAINIKNQFLKVYPKKCQLILCLTRQSIE